MLITDTVRGMGAGGGRGGLIEDLRCMYNTVNRFNRLTESTCANNRYCTGDGGRRGPGGELIEDLRCMYNTVNRFNQLTDSTCANNRYCTGDGGRRGPGGVNRGFTVHV